MPLALLSPRPAPSRAVFQVLVWGPGRWLGQLPGLCLLGLLMASVSPTGASCSVVAPWDPSSLPPAALALSSACCCPVLGLGGGSSACDLGTQPVSGGCALVVFLSGFWHKLEAPKPWSPKGEGLLSPTPP